MIKSTPGDIAGTLKHNLLKNQYLKYTKLILVGSTRDEGLCDEARELLARLGQCTRDYNPKLLVDTLEPLQTLSDQQRQELGEQLNNQFATKMETQLEQLALTSKRFLTALDTWEEDCRGTSEPSDESYHSVREASQKLYDVLKILPRGVWLP